MYERIIYSYRNQIYKKNRKAFMVKAFKFGFLSTKLIFSVVIFIAKINLWL